jgi:spore coat protein U-like protein
MTSINRSAGSLRGVIKTVVHLMALVTVLLLSTSIAHLNHAAAIGTVSLMGELTGLLRLTVTPQTGYNSLDLTVNVSDILIATVLERCNNKQGYTVTLESANGVAAAVNTAHFRGVTENPDTLTYSIRYEGNPVTFGTTAGVGRALVTDSSIKTTGLGILKSLTVSYSGASVFLAPGTYSDTLRLTIADK